MANDAATKTVVLFGGYDGVAHYNDTWTWDGTTWTRVSPQHAPSPRRSFGMAYDAARGEIVLFGGYDGIAILGDTWVWNGTDWVERFPQHSPPPSDVLGMAFDAGTKRVVLFGGEGGDSFTTWLWDGSDWLKVVRHRPPDWRQLQGMSRDGAHVLMFGGEDILFEDFIKLHDTSYWDGSKWHKLLPASSPSRREAMGMAFDDVRGEVVLFGGVGVTEFGDTWIWSGGNWTRRHPTASPPGRERMGMAWDSVRGEIVLFGGTKRLDTCFYGDTWTWDGSTWTEQ